MDFLFTANSLKLVYKLYNFHRYFKGSDHIYIPEISVDFFQNSESASSGKTFHHF